MFDYTQYMHGPVRYWLILLVVWTLIWKGLALWKAAHKEQKEWFIVILVLNTVGILDILYLYIFSERKPKHEEIQAPAPQMPQQ